MNSIYTLGFLAVYAVWLFILLIITGLLQKRPGSTNATVNDFFRYARKGKRWSGAFVCVFNGDFTKILMLSRKPDPKHGKRWGRKGEWGNIGGSVEPGETPTQALVREAREEIGVGINPKRLVKVHAKRISQPKLYPCTMNFYATSIKESVKIRLNDESYRYKWFDLKKLPDKMLDNKKDILKWRDIARSCNDTTLKPS